MRARLTTLTLLTCAATAALSAARADAEPIRLRPGFSPHPLLTARLEGRVDDVRVADRGWRSCDPGGGRFTTDQPMLTFDVEAAMPLRIRLEDASGNQAGGGGIIVGPDGRYFCDDDKNQFFMTSWPKGRYQLYLSSVSIGVAAIVRFEDPVRSTDELTRALAGLPVVALGAAGEFNPRHQQVKATVAVDAGDAGPTCAKARQRVMPLARLEVTRASDWYLASGDLELFVLTADQRCHDPTEVAHLPVGTHVLWMIVRPGQPTATDHALEIDDRDAGLTLPAAERREVGALDAPLVITGKVRPGQRWYARRGACAGAARAPDLYLHSDRPLQHVTLSLLWSKAPQQLHLLGPIEQLETTSLPRCGDVGDAFPLDLMEGTYAVWIGGEAAAAGTDYHLLVLRDGVTVDPLTTLAPIPEELTLAERAYKNHYPYFRGSSITDWTAMMTTAPDRLFVYTRTEVEADSGTRLPAGEPLLVIWSNKDKTHAHRHDGSYVTVDTRLVDGNRPATVALPTRPTLPEVESLSQATQHAGPEDARALAAYRKVDDRYTACLGNYLAKHDPTWGHGHEVYKISGNGRVVNVSDQVGAAGARKCGESKLVAAERTLMKALAKTRTARFTAHLAAVRKRFGL